jgi:hypothetical protein
LITTVALIETLPVDEQVAPRPLLEPVPDDDELELDDDDDEEELEVDELELDELLDDVLDDELVVVGAYEHHAEVTPENAPPKFELLQATLLVKVPYENVPDLPSAT